MWVGAFVGLAVKDASVTGKIVGWRETYLPLAKGESVGVHCGAFAGAASDVGIAFGRKSFFGLCFEFIGVFGYCGIDVFEHAIGVDFVLVCAVLAGVRARVLDFRDICHDGARWGVAMVGSERDRGDRILGTSYRRASE